MAQIHREPYITVAGLTDSKALIAWGAFYFEVGSSNSRFKLIEDKNLKNVNPPRKSSIGESSEPYGNAKVEYWEKTDPSNKKEITVDLSKKVNHVWIEDLKPNTKYQYRVFVGGTPWAEHKRHDWVDKPNQGMMLGNREYENEFTTYPRIDEATPDFAFAVIGDYGRGIKDPDDDNKQKEIAVALEKVVRQKDVRFVITTGDNIYGHGFFGRSDTGNEDSDWFFSHYQPYRYILNQIPFYPSCGNHDTDETEKSDDYIQLLDNFYISQRFFSSRDEGEAVKDKGLFFHFQFGKDVEFVSVDSSKHDGGDRAFSKDVNKSFIRNVFPAITDRPTAWRIPFFHHPPYVDGPSKSFDKYKDIRQQLVPLFEKAGVRLVFNGHEHNGQISLVNKIYYVLTGAAGELRDGKLKGQEEAHNIAWLPKHHFLLVEYKSGKMHITPYGEKNGEAVVLAEDIRRPNKEKFPIPLTIELS